MQAFHNDPAIKEKYLTRVRQHIVADNLLRGTGWEDGKGCAVGCTLESYDHAQYPIELGIPEWLGHAKDTLFEGMSLKKSETWPEKFLDAVPVGLDDAGFLRVKAQFLLVVLNSALETFNHDNFPDVKAAIGGSVALWRRDDLGTIEWLKAAKAAKAIARGAVEAAALSALAARAAEAVAAAAVAGAVVEEGEAGEAARAARAVARAVARAAEAAARGAAEAAAEAVAARASEFARAEKYDYFADELLRILKGTTDDK
jgi:hypothetical protein